MSQHLEIENFNTITHVSFPVQKMLVLIGHQASGKSTISKAIYFFKSLRDDLILYLQKSYEQDIGNLSISNFAKQAKRKFIQIYGSVTQFEQMRIFYDYGNSLTVTILPTDDKQYTDLIFSENLCDEMKSLLNETRAFYDEINSRSLTFSASREFTEKRSRENNFFKDLNRKIERIFGDDRDLFFIPAGRSVITALSQQRYNIDLGSKQFDDLDANNLKLDFLMKGFIERIDDIKPLFNQNVPRLIQAEIQEEHEQQQERLELTQQLIANILRGDYHYRDGTETLEFSSGKHSLINFASSGQQEVLWILLFILLIILNKRKVFLVIEEPEAHLFPVAQKQLVDLIALLANQSDNQIIVTTHSPYILAAYNNLLYAHNLGEHKREEIANIVNPLLWLDSNQIGSYILENGQSRSLIDQETHLIHSAEIDRASEIIVDIFNQLFEHDDE
ncbi:MAG: AAA family ATPase [Spirulinaceae cyanobacterium]